MQSPDELRGCIAAGFPFTFGFTVWSSFDAIGTDGFMPVPNTDNEHTIGGHCVLACDFDDEMVAPPQYGWSNPGAYKCRNSWGTTWSAAGFFYMPYEVMHDPGFCADFWQIDAVAS
jgi:C1A family cysteine protease